MTPSSVASYDTTVDPATVRAQSTFLTAALRDLAVAPGGSEFLPACGGPGLYRYSTADLSQAGTYPAGSDADAVAVDANGDVAAGTVNSEASPDLCIYAQDGSTPLNTFNLGEGTMPRGLAWSADGSDLLVVLANLSLHVIYDPMRTQATLSLTGPSVAYITKQVTLTGGLKINGGTAPAGTSITVTRTAEGGTGAKQFDVTTAADGGYALTDTPPALGVSTYTAVYSGNTTTARAMAAHAVSVSRIPPSLTLKTGSTTYTYHPPSLSRRTSARPPRIRADYIPADNRNKGNKSAWLYMTITS